MSESSATGLAARPGGPRIARRMAAVTAAGAALIALAALTEIWAAPAAAAGAGLAATAGALLLIGLLRTAVRRAGSSLMLRYIQHDAAPGLVADADGAILGRNAAAIDRFGAGDATVEAALRGIFANPEAVIYRLQTRAQASEAAREDVVTRHGALRLAVHRMAGNSFLWRLEDLPPRAEGGRNAAAFAVPMLTVGRSGAILFMNEAARELVGRRVKSLDRLFPAMPPRPGEINTIAAESGPRPVILAEASAGPGRREFFLLPAETRHGVPAGRAADALPVPVLRLSAEGEILHANRLAAALLGRDCTLPLRLDDVMEGLGRSIGDWLREAAEGRATHQSEFLRLIHADKETFVQVTLARGAPDDDAALIAVLSDATELKTLEAQFVQSQKMQAIGQLAGGVAHDFNNLLTAISGHCDLLLLRHDPGDSDYGDLIQIHQNANRAAALVGQLLAFSRKQTLQPQILDLRDTLSDLAHLLNRLVGEKVVLTLSHDPLLSRIRADRRQLEQVLMNLVVNARDAMPGGGEIRIDTENVVLTEPFARDRATVPPGTYVAVRVVDQGEGIPPDKLQKVFEPFFTTKRTGEGTGLGLSTAYGIVKQTGGFIFVDSAVGAGTCFTLYFPAHEGPAAEACAPEPKPAPPMPADGEGVILLVEDEAPVRAFASRALRLRGYTVLEAACAEDALRLLDDPEVAVDIFVTDVVMPGMDGPSWVKRALTDRPQARVIFVSGYAEGALGDMQRDIPQAVFLPKPFSLVQLTETVDRQLH